MKRLALRNQLVLFWPDALTEKPQSWLENASRFIGKNSFRPPLFFHLVWKTAKNNWNCLYLQMNPDSQYTSIVISPLNALMDDQVGQLAKHNISSIAVLTKELLTTARSKNYDVIFTSPEFCIQDCFRDFLLNIADRVCVIAIDEAQATNKPRSFQFPSVQSPQCPAPTSRPEILCAEWSSV